MTGPANIEPVLGTAVSDLEVESKTVQGKLYHVAYRVEGSDERIVVATTRPETMLGDTALAIHPKDPRTAKLRGKRAILPIVGRELPVIEDGILVDREFGTGIVKVTPAHDVNDFAAGQRNGLRGPVHDVHAAQRRSRSVSAFMNACMSSPFEAFNRLEAEMGAPKDHIRRVNATNPLDNAWARLERGELGRAAFAGQFEHADLREPLHAHDEVALVAGAGEDLRELLLEADLEETPDNLRVNLTGDGADALLHQGGEALDALQVIVNTAFRREDRGADGELWTLWLIGGGHWLSRP